MFFDWKKQFEKIQLTRDPLDDAINNKELDSLAKMIKDTTIPLQEHKQQLFGFLKTHVPHFK